MSMESRALFTTLENRFALERQQAKVVIIGLGATGFSVARFLHDLGIRFAVVDSRGKPPMIDRLVEEMPDVPVFTGGFDQAAMEVATHLVVSPGVSLREYAIHRASVAGVRIISDIDLFACIVDKPVLAITGSNGKSTVTTMLGAMGNAVGVKTAVGGNLGTPALDLLQQEAEFYALELSSFQLERTSLLNAKAATVLNVSSDHLDRHQGIAGYAAEKQRIFRGSGVMVLNADDPVVMAMRQADRRCLTFSINGRADFWLDQTGGCLMRGNEELMPRREFPLEGKHNIANALAAFALGTAAGWEPAGMARALASFRGLDHRMQKVSEIGGIAWVNDSKATNIGACVAALQGYDTKVVLIAGGDAKGAEMSELAPAVSEKAKAVVLMGKDAGLIEKALAGRVPVYFAADMKDAVRTASSLAEPGDTVLLSPACASLDQYKNYMDRGEKFAAAVRELAT